MFDMYDYNYLIVDDVRRISVDDFCQTLKDRRDGWLRSHMFTTYNWE